MIKDVVVNLAIGKPHDVAAAYAVALAEAFDAHLRAIAFAYEPVVPPSIMGGVPREVIALVPSGAIPLHERRGEAARPSVRNSLAGRALYRGAGRGRYQNAVSQK